METRYEVETVPFLAGDGMGCNVVHVRGERPPTRQPVLLIHGAGVRANIFLAPVTATLVDVLVADGFDVWLENWRASADLRANRWTLDQAAVHDHPEAVRLVSEATGADRISAVVHCQGSTSFMMSAIAGLVPQVTTVVSNAVSLHPVVPTLAGWKMRYLLPMVHLLTRYLDPRWGVEAPDVVAAALMAWVRLAHHECTNAVCRMVSFTYGVGAPTLWSHENLNEETHDWLTEEFGHVPLTFFAQMERSLRAGHLVPVDERRELPTSFVDRVPATDARFVFIAGQDNRCFLPVSQARTFEFFDQHHPRYHSLRVFPGYGHLDMFMGKDAAVDVFPVIRDELRRAE